MPRWLLPPVRHCQSGELPMTANWWQRVLRYEFTLSFSVGLILAIAAAVIAVSLIWPHAPSWIGYPIGFALAMGEGIRQRRTARMRRNHARS